MKHTIRIRAILTASITACALLLCAAAAEDAESPVVSQAVEPEVAEAREVFLGGDPARIGPEGNGFALDGAANAEDGRESPDFEIVDGVLASYRGSDAAVALPAGVTRIGPRAFYKNDNLESVAFPEGLSAIGDSAFEGCSSLKSAALPEGLAAIGDSAFSECYSLESVSLPGSLASVGKGAFAYCASLERIELPSGLAALGEGVFRGCGSLQSVALPGGLAAIGGSAFYGCGSLERITLPDNLASIGSYAFCKCEFLDEITLPGGVSSIETGAFSGCNALASVKIQSKEISIAEDAFGRTEPTFSIVCGSSAIQWADYNEYSYTVYGHTPVIDPSVAPTYSKTGLSEGSHCASCGEVIKARKRVARKPLPRNGLLLLKNTSRICKVGDAIQIVVDRDDAKSFVSGAPGVAGVSETGLVTPLRAGVAKIVVTLESGDKLTLSLKVTDPAALSRTTLKLRVGQSATLKVKGAAGRGITWSSGNPEIAAVTDGRIVAKGVGKCAVTAQVANGKKLVCRVTVVETAKLSEKSYEFSPGDTGTLRITGLAGRGVTWSSSNSFVVSVESGDDGVATIMAHAKGSVIIRARIRNGNTLACKVKVVNPLTVTVNSVRDESVYNDACLKFQSHSNRKIVRVTLEILQYDSRGRKLQSPYDSYSLQEVINPRGSRAKHFLVNDEARRVKVRIKEVIFADTTLWKP